MRGCLVLAVLLAGLPAAREQVPPPAAEQRTAAEPAPISNAAFWTLVADLSEPGGDFGSDNLVSNEAAYQHVVPSLSALPAGGAYIGVGPDQNFTYVLASRPAIAFIVDIRRGNLVLHLLYKALVELSADRADFLARLFARPRPAGAGTVASAGDLLEAFGRAGPSEALFAASAADVAAHLAGHRGAPLAPADRERLIEIHRAFVRFGPAITYASTSSREDRRVPSFAELQLASDLAGRRHAYLASESAFERLRIWQRRNLIVPVVGDFAGPRTLRAIGGHLARRRLAVTAFYASNVEEYLFGDGRWPAFYANLEALPWSPGSLLLRSTPGSSRVERIQPLLAAVNGGTIRTYADITGRGGIR